MQPPNSLLVQPPPVSHSVHWPVLFSHRRQPVPQYWHAPVESLYTPWPSSGF
jgi:hypothetical protein